MLNNVPKGINALSRNVIINHPNTFNCQVYRKETTRKGSNEADFAGNPTMGGIGVVDSDDEEQFEYVYKGEGYALPAENFSPSPLVDRNDANVGYTDEFRFLIVPADQYGEPEYFEIHTHDLVYLMIYGLDEDKPAKLCFEVVGRETTLNIPPFTYRYVCNRRDDLHLTIDGEFLSELEENEDTGDDTTNEETEEETEEEADDDTDANENTEDG